MPSNQIIFFERSKSDLANVNCSITVTDAVATNTGQTIVDYVRNRSNNSAWLTTGSNDSADTELENSDITDIILIEHNWDAYTIQYWTGSAYADFSTAINESSITTDTNHYNFDSVNTNKIKIIIDSTQVADADKRLSQLIVTDRFGQLTAFPEIKKPTVSLNKKRTKMLSGKSFITESTGYFACDLDVKVLSADADLTIIENIYFARQGILVWICAGDQSQFSSVRIGYRLKDLYLMRPSNEWQPEWYKGLYKSGMKIKMKLVESVN